MSATDELRAELTKRGVEWMPCAWEPQTETFYKNEDGVAFIATESNAQDGFLLRTDMAVTSAQAIAATLGRGTCHMDKVVYPFSDNDEYWMVCSECGFAIYMRPIFQPLKYCSHCGARVVEVDE